MAKKSKDEVLFDETKPDQVQDGQVYEEDAHENPFDIVWRATILETRANKDGVIYVKFEASDSLRVDKKNAIEYVTESEFRKRFPNLVE